MNGKTNKMKTIQTAGIWFLITLPIAVQAQKKEEEKYRKASEELRQQVWAWDKPQFKVKDIPAEYANSSKVIIAEHTELSAESKNKAGFQGLTFMVDKVQTITEVSREIVKLNDKTAVEEYSELSFIQLIKSSGFYNKDKLTTYLGVKVIKPNGTVKEVNADDIVLTKDESKEKRAKLAIPDLQPGDILDYFVATEQIVSNDFSASTYDIDLFDNAPVLSRSFHGQLGKKYAVDYRSYNDAPEMKVGKNEDNEIIIDVEKKNMPPFETSLWVIPARQLPFIRMHIALGSHGLGSSIGDFKRPGEILPNKNPEEYMSKKFENFLEKYNRTDKSWIDSYDGRIDKVAKKKAEQMGIKFDELSEGEKAALLCYTLRFSFLKTFNISKLSKPIYIGDKYDYQIAFALFILFRTAGLDPAMLASTYRNGVKMTELSELTDLIYTAYLPKSNLIFNLQSVFDIPYDIPEDIEGQKGSKSFSVNHLGFMSMKKAEQLNVKEVPDMPESNSDKNAHIENLNLSLSPEKSSLRVKRSTVLKGHLKTGMQEKLIPFEDFYESERNSFKEEISFIQEKQDKKNGKKYVEEVINAFADARKNQKEAALKEVQDEFVQEITDFSNFKTDTLGIRHTAPNFVYSSSFNLGGLVKKAGNNLIIEIGKIQGNPLKVNREQRKRDIDIYMPYARSFEYNIELDIPDGYTAEGVEALNKKVTNETGFFTAEAAIKGKIITIRVKKHYLNGFEPASNWGKLLEFIDASNDWLNAKLLFRKS